MLKQITIVSLVAIAGTALAQGDDSASAMFQRLDSNGDGVISQSEAEADARVSRLYDTLDTRGTIENSAANANAEGITQAQFEAGMTAAQRSGAVGPAASGGETYKVYPDGSQERVEGTGVGQSKRTD
ncbi:hypothetical protein [Salinisphaera sp. T31B1]|uniref:hypothetical protein n=1 Tax=Salinisphaera sp. T31B1 TaxID=727963 RepID=UPI003340D209